jgi:hypothetical protein
MHAGQVTLLVRAGKLGRSEVLRMEIFAVLVIAALAAAWVVGAPPMLGGPVLLGLAAPLGVGLVLNPDDREHLCDLWSRARQRLGGRTAGP